MQCGYSAVVDLSHYEDQTVEIGAVAVREHGIFDRLTTVSTRVTLPSSRPILNADFCASADWIVVTGALGTALPPARVEVHVDGALVTLARPWRQSAGPAGTPSAVMDGFDASVPVPAQHRGGIARIDVLAELLDGSEHRVGPVFVSTRTPPPAIPTEHERRRVEQLREDLQMLPSRGARREARHRILVVTHSLLLGGGQLYLDELLRGLLPHPEISCLVVTPQDGPLRQPLEERGATVLISGAYPTDDPVMYETRLLEIAAAARWHNANVALVNTMSAAIGADLCCRLRIPYLWAVHESLPPTLFWTEAYGPHGYHPEIQRLGLAAISGAERIIFEAAATLELFRGATADDRLIKIEYGVNFADIDRYCSEADRSLLRSAAGYSDEDIVLVALGTLEPRKAQTALVLAFAEVVKQHPAARLALIGDMPGAYSAAVHSLIDRLELGRKIKVLPVTSRPYDWYLLADVVLSASDLESMPRSLIEAMGFGKVVLSTDVFGVPELVTDGHTGFLMEARDLSAVIGGLERVLTLSPQERADIGRAASAAARRNHDAALYIQAYRRLLETTGLP